MMTSNITLRTSNSTILNSSNGAILSSSNDRLSDSRNSFDPIELIANTKPIRTIAEMYSGLLEEHVTPRFTLHLINVQMAAFMTIFPAGFSLFTRILCLLWFATSLCLAKRAYEKQEA